MLLLQVQISKREAVMIHISAQPVADPGFPVGGEAPSHWGGGALALTWVLFGENCQGLNLTLSRRRQ